MSYVGAADEEWRVQHLAHLACVTGPIAAGRPHVAVVASVTVTASGADAAAEESDCRASATAEGTASGNDANAAATGPVARLVPPLRFRGCGCTRGFRQPSAACRRGEHLAVVRDPRKTAAWAAAAPCWPR